jgi:PBP1b-binding outer membrane lipoprotein LpoB
MIKKLLTIIMISLIAIGFTGCVQEYKMLKIAEIDNTQKSITIPATGPLIFDIKSLLIENKWKVEIWDGAISENGLKTNVSDSKYKFHTKYRLIIRNSYFNDDDIKSFHISLVDTVKNTSVLDLKGKATNRDNAYEAEEVAKKLLLIMNGGTLPKKEKYQSSPEELY